MRPPRSAISASIFAMLCIPAANAGTAAGEDGSIGISDQSLRAGDAALSGDGDRLWDWTVGERDCARDCCGGGGAWTPRAAS